MDERLEINPVEDHSERFNVKADVLAKANEAIRHFSVQRKTDDGIEVEIVGDRILHKRTEQDYVVLWKKFLDEEAVEFANTLSYDIVDIDRVGIKKFIDANDWKVPEDVKKWKTDAGNVVICRHCNDEFAVLDISGRLEMYGVCPTCAPSFDFDKLMSVTNYESEKEKYADLTDPPLRFMAARIRVIEQFYADKAFRDEFLRKG